MKASRILLLIPTLSYRAQAFMEAGRKLGVEIAVGSDQRQVLSEFAPGKSMMLNLREPEEATKTIVKFAKMYPVNAIVPTDDDTTIVAAMASEALSLPHNPAGSVMATRNKYRFRERMSHVGLLSPHFELLSVGDNPEGVSPRIPFPCVLKPLALSASRGVSRANDPSEFIAAFHRLTAILREPDAIARGKGEARQILIEEYIPGKEVVLEGILLEGNLKLLALFDKPEPLEGPYFEETIYVTPSRLPKAIQDKIRATAIRVVEIVGLREGPIHAEFR
ncbi:ATP-grasp domain-containing protein, partial [candidate division TA06 bacterium]|nr:ATP-grasp domain-containing protein [candidate division TA06 bacterium]